MKEEIICPNCLGTGETLLNRRVMRACKICNGEGFVSEDTESHYIRECIFDNT